MTLFERCVEAAGAGGIGPYDQLEDIASQDDVRAITRAVLQTLLDHTESPRTAEEVSRVLAEGV